MNGLYLITFLGVAFTVIVLPLLEPLLRYMNTADELMDMALAYMRVIAMGLVATALYNYLSGVLRAIGDADHPFYFLLISSVTNLILDLVFILVFDMGVAGAAWATVISQALSAVLCGWWLFAKTGMIRRPDESSSMTAISPKRMGKLFAAGLPMGLNYSVTAIGIMAMQSSVNTLGAVAVAAHTAGEKIRRIITVPLESVGTAMNTYTAQNYGANRVDRIRKGIGTGLLIQIGISVSSWGLLLFTKEPLVSILLGDLASAEAQSAVRYLTLISTLFVFHGLLMIFRNTLQGMNHGMLAMLSSIIEIVGRVLCGWLAVTQNSFDLICVTNPAAWLLAGVYCLVWTYWYLGKEEKLPSRKL